jgi:UDP-N-acetylglucosamine acyltransferase
MIHTTAVIHPGAQLHPTVEVGPFAVIDENVIVEADCRIGPHVHLTGHTVIGPGNRFHAGCVIGDAPQDLKYADAPTRLIIGGNNVFREHVTVHRANKTGEDTVIGSDCFLMANSHVGHNARLGNGVILANGALIAGHVGVDDRVFISGNCLVHQFVRIGTFALMQGGAAISKDLPPYTIARGDNGICGLNIVGLRRAGFSATDRTGLKKLYHALFRRKATLRQALAEAREHFTSPAARTLLEFVAASKRGVCADTGGAGTEDEQ